MDQSRGTHQKHFAQFGIPFTGDEDFDTKSAVVREMLVSAPSLGEVFTGAIVHDDLFDLTDSRGVPLQKVLEEQGVIVIGKKLGLNDITGLATGLDELPGELDKLVQLGVHMIKTRTTIKFGMPEFAEEAARQMVRVHEATAKNGDIAAILEPEFLIKNEGNLQQNEQIMTDVLRRMIKGIDNSEFRNHPFFIKTSFPTPGTKSSESINPEASAEAFERICKNAGIPKELLIVFLSGGHSSATSRSLLQTMAQVRVNAGSSFSRANLERPYQATFPREGVIDVPAGQRQLYAEGVKNQLAIEGLYYTGLEDATPEQILDEANRMRNPQ